MSELKPRVLAISSGRDEERGEEDGTRQHVRRDSNWVRCSWFARRIAHAVILAALRLRLASQSFLDGEPIQDGLHVGDELSNKNQNCNDD